MWLDDTVAMDLDEGVTAFPLVRIRWSYNCLPWHHVVQAFILCVNRGASLVSSQDSHKVHADPKTRAFHKQEFRVYLTCVVGT